MGDGKEEEAHGRGFEASIFTVVGRLWYGLPSRLLSSSIPSLCVLGLKFLNAKIEIDRALVAASGNRPCGLAGPYIKQAPLLARHCLWTSPSLPQDHHLPAVASRR
jgi:hypothetical protein